MRVVAYSIRSFEKELLAKANQKKHDITLISNKLTLETVSYAEGKDAVLVFINDEVSAPVINRLADLGIKYVSTRSVETGHIDRKAAGKRGIKLANVPSYLPQAIAEYAVTLALALGRKPIPMMQQNRVGDFRINNQLGFNFFGKTVGLIGLDHAARAVAPIFKGLGCRVVGYDVSHPEHLEGIEPVTLDELFKAADIISLHVASLTSETPLINRETLSEMKNGVMIINTGGSNLINPADILYALEQGKVGYFGADAYEIDKETLFYDCQSIPKDSVLAKLLSLPNVIITPHQAFLTVEAMQQIAAQTISNLDNWQQNKCAGKACACAKQCRAVPKVSIEKF